jgi:hypothetical protein
MSERTQAYKFVLTLNSKVISGLETTQLKITPNFEEELLKANSGNPAKTLKDYDVEISIGCKAYTNTGDEDFETLRAYSAAGAEHDFVYGDPAGETISGHCKVIDHSENTDSLNTGTWNGSVKAVKGTVVFSNE